MLDPEIGDDRAVQHGGRLQRDERGDRPDGEQNRRGMPHPAQPVGHDRHGRAMVRLGHTRLSPPLTLRRRPSDERRPRQQRVLQPHEPGRRPLAGRAFRLRLEGPRVVRIVHVEQERCGLDRPAPSGRGRAVPIDTASSDRGRPSRSRTCRPSANDTRMFTGMMASPYRRTTSSVTYRAGLSRASSTYVRLPSRSTQPLTDAAPLENRWIP